MLNYELGRRKTVGGRCAILGVGGSGWVLGTGDLGQGRQGHFVLASDSSAQMRVERNELSRNSSPARWLAVTDATCRIISTGSRARCEPARES